MPELSAVVALALADQFMKHAARVRELASPFTNEQFWRKPFPFGNSFGHLVLHLTGNLNYYVGTQIANTGYVRDRPREFTDGTPPSKDEALDGLDDAVSTVVKTIRAQSNDDWSRSYEAVGAHAKTRLEMVLQCASHMQHHIGQMIYLSYQLQQSRGT